MGENEETNSLLKSHQKQALEMIKSRVMMLRKRMCSYGVSNDQFIKIMHELLAKILFRGKSKKFRDVNDIIKEITRYIKQRKGDSIKLMLEIIQKIDYEVAQIQSSEFYSQNSNEDEQKLKSQLKIQGRRGEYYESASDDKRNFQIIQKKGTDMPYVKLECLPDFQIEQKIQVEDTRGRNRTRSKGRNGRSKSNINYLM